MCIYTFILHFLFDCSQCYYQLAIIIIIPIIACGLCLEVETIHVTVDLRLESNVCVRHACICGTRVDAFANKLLAILPDIRF